MLRGIVSVGALAWFPAVLGCAASGKEAGSPQIAPGEDTSEAKARGAAGSDAPRDEKSSLSSKKMVLEDSREPDPSRALPAVSTRHIGMHIGGEPNTPEAKRPFLTAFERAETGFLFCYRHVERPMRGGTFGVDLYVPTRGGHPEVRAVRQRLGDESFENCMVHAFEQISLPPQERPTMLSYSLRFDVKGR